jgi:hypothetical protein
VPGRSRGLAAAAAEQEDEPVLAVGWAGTRSPSGGGSS